ncbi:hypothetical protein J6590_047664 [Homalodisca vitripennis]|nr:hypothetical protein J6590_047664 [Homalodisca vitripennis]
MTAASTNPSDKQKNDRDFHAARSSPSGQERIVATDRDGETGDRRTGDWWTEKRSCGLRPRSSEHSVQREHPAAASRYNLNKGTYHQILTRAGVNWRVAIHNWGEGEAPRPVLAEILCERFSSSSSSSACVSDGRAQLYRRSTPHYRRPVVLYLTGALPCYTIIYRPLFSLLLGQPISLLDRLWSSQSPHLWSNDTVEIKPAKATMASRLKLGALMRSALFSWEITDYK